MPQFEKKAILRLIMSKLRIHPVLDALIREDRAQIRALCNAVLYDADLHRL